MVQILWLAIIGLFIFLTFLIWEWVPYIVGGLLALVFLIWTVVSAISPSKPDRRCPRCEREGLVKIRRGEPGVRCEKCGFCDENLHVAYLDDW